MRDAALPAPLKILACLLCLLACPAAFAERSLYVATNGAHQTPFTNWAMAATTIWDAVTLATNSDSVWVSNGIYASPGTGLHYSTDANFFGTNMVFFDQSVRVQSVNGPEVTIVDGNGFSNRCFYFDNTGGVVAGFTIRNGLAARAGGFFTRNGTVSNCLVINNQSTISAGGGAADDNARVVDCIFSNNVTGGDGGGLLKAGGGEAALIENCAFIANHAGQGGGAYIDAVFRGCRVAGNAVTTNGGGLYNFGGYVAGCTVVCNVAVNEGGGIYDYYHWAKRSVTDCVITGNAAAAGAGIRLLLGWGNGTSISNCLVAENQATNGYGGGIYVWGSFGPFERCVISNNTARGYGGGVMLQDAGILRNCLICNNTAIGEYGGGVTMDGAAGNGPFMESCTVVSNVAGVHGGGVMTLDVASISVSNSIIVSNFSPSADTKNIFNFTAAQSNNYYYSCSTPSSYFFTGNNNLTNDPIFVNYAGGNYRLVAWSPCINSGANEAWMGTAVDLLDRPRIYYGRVDIGCYEYFLDVKINGVPIDRIKSINGVDKHRIIRIYR